MILRHYVFRLWFHAWNLLNITSPLKQVTYVSLVLKDQHAHSYFCLGVHVPPGVSIWGYMFIFEGTHILELFFHSKRIEAMKSDHLDVYNSDNIMLWKC